MSFEYVQKAWDVYKRNILSFIGGLYIIFLPALLLIGLGLVMIFELFAGQGFGALQLAGLVTGIVMVASGWICAISMQVGYYGMAAASLKKSTGISEMIEVAKARWKSAVGASLITLGMGLACLIPILLGIAAASVSPALSVLGVGIGYAASFILSILVVFVFPAIAVDGLGAVEAVKRSISLGWANFATLCVLMLLFSAFMVLAAITIIGLVVVFLMLMPMMYIAFTALYMDLHQAPRQPAGPRRRRKR